MISSVGAAEVGWKDVQTLKVEQLKKAAANAVAQQRLESFPPQPLKADFSGAGGVAVEPSADWDVDGDGQCLKVTLKDIPANQDHLRIADRLQVRFSGKVNLLEKATGLAFWIKTPDDLSKDLRFGVHFKVEGTDQDPVIIADTPLRQKFGDNPHQAYLDWGYVFDHSVGVFKVPPKDFFTRVTGFDLVVVQKRLPAEDGVKLAPASATFYIDGLQLVDFYDGSYDSDRFPKGRPINAAQPIISQGRTQQVASLCARFGGEAGAKSALRAMDMMARIQCWDGSWPEMQTRLEGEWTHGMILADMAACLAELRKQNRPELAEKVKIRQWDMPRGELYEQMIYRGAMSRWPAPISKFRDTYTSGQGALTGGCNRPMIFTASQWIAAQVLSRPAWKKQVLAEYDQNMADLAAHQGVTAGGWPIFGEGDRYQGQGIHWDGGYTTDHVYIMSMAARLTGDQRWGEMMKKFDTVVKAMILPNGYEIDGALSERSSSKAVGLKAPDLVFQEASRCGATALAQWGANASEHLWSHWPTGMWAYAGNARGYGLGAFLTWQQWDLQAEPQPRSLGRVFARQWPTWSATWMNKEGQAVRKSMLVVRPDGRTVNTFAWEVGQYPVVVGVPLDIAAEGAAIEVEALVYNGNVAALPEKVDARLVVEQDGKARTVEQALKDGAINVEITQPTRLRLTFVGVEDVAVEWTMRPQQAGTTAKVACKLLRKPQPYEHVYAKPEESSETPKKEEAKKDKPEKEDVKKP